MVRSSQLGSWSVPLAGIVVLLAAAGAIYYYSAGRDEAPKVPEVAPQPEPKQEAPPQVAPVVVPEPAKEPPKPLGSEMVYPDGSRYPNLNGVAIAPAVLWPKDRPYSPINGTLKDAQGVEWYTHVDGSRSTVMIDPGSKRPVSLVANPTKPVPIAEEDLRLLEQQKKQQQQPPSGKQ
jgi:hypothetical protein